MGLEYSSSSCSHGDRGNPTKTKRARERERKITLRPVLSLKNGGAGVDRARTAVMVREVESSLDRQLLAANNRLTCKNKLICENKLTCELANKPNSENQLIFHVGIVHSRKKVFLRK